MTQQYAEVATDELRRFFQVAAMFDEQDRGLAFMPVSYVDEMWHALEMDPARYHKFTLDAVGTEVEHLEIPGEGVVEWVSLYEQQFGKLNPVWFVDKSGTFNSRAHEEYLKTGVWECSWKCSPAVHTKGKPKPSKPILPQPATAA